MLKVNLLIFFSIFILVFWIGRYVYFIFHNKRVQVKIDNFIDQAIGLRPIIFQNIKLRYWTTSGQKSWVTLNNYCSLYLFDNCFAIVRRQNFPFKVLFAPILITSDIVLTKKMFDSIDSYKPNSIVFKRIIKGEIDIKLSDPIYKYYIIDITLKGLTNEQISQLEDIKNWY